MKIIESVEVMESFGMIDLTIDDAMDVNGGCCPTKACDCKGKKDPPPSCSCKTFVKTC